MPAVIKLVETIVEPGSKDGELCVQLQVSDKPAKEADKADLLITMRVPISGRVGETLASLEMRAIEKARALLEEQRLILDAALKYPQV